MEPTASFYRRRGKRAFDLLLSALLVLALAPILALTPLIVALLLGRPVLFHQRRPGYSGSPFYLHKFRSMNEKTDDTGRLLSDEDRLTSFGRFLRRWSLDELPELFNVLRGEMSLVGPRPLLMRYLSLYTEEQMRRHDVRPGITGWAQINGRNTAGWEEKFALDVWYVDHLSFGLDLQILFRTIAQVLSGRGITAPGHATMPEFDGGKK